jgi:hypothetical protein
MNQRQQKGPRAATDDFVTYPTSAPNVAIFGAGLE